MTILVTGFCLLWLGVEYRSERNDFSGSLRRLGRVG